MASTILPNVRHAQITGGQFSIVDQRSVNHTTVHHDRNGTLKGVDLLCEHCALGALLDSNERFDPPRCAEDTRAAIIEEILAWIYGGGDGASMAWLFGGAGAGKSALAQTIAEICHREGRLAGGFFFSRTSTGERSDGTRLIPTLVFQLLEAFPGLKLHVEECIDSHARLFSRAPRTHMDLLFIRPLLALKRQTLPIPSEPAPSLLPTPTPSSKLKSLGKPKSRRRGFVAKIVKTFTTKANPGPLPSGTPPSPNVAATATTAASSTIAANTEANLNDLLRPRLIVIDGLDECNGQDIQIELLRLLAGAIPLIPFPLRFLVASRPEGYITRTINYDKSFEGLDVRKIDLGNDENADNDIRRFLIRGFEEIRRSHPLRSLLGPLWPSEQAIENLVLKSSSHFIYASTAIKYVQYSRGRPDARLEIILGLSVPPEADKPFAQLDTLYTHIFMSMDEADRITVKDAFGILAFTRLGHPYPVETSLIKLEEYLGMQAGEINILLEPLLSLVVLPEDRDHNIVILHASLFDFLLDQSRSAGLHLDLEMARDIISNHFLKEISAYTLDIELLQSRLKDVLILPFWYFLYHCHVGRNSDDVKEYLITVPYIYDCILHPKFVVKYLTEEGADGFSWISIVLQSFFMLLLQKDFGNGQRWHTKHCMQIEQQLQSIHGGLEGGLRLLDDTLPGPLFKDISRQSEHRALKALANILVSIHGLEAISEALVFESGRQGPQDTEETLRSHLLVIFLPHLTQSSKDVKICTVYSKETGCTLLKEDELHLVLKRRLEEYLQRINGVAELSELQDCKEAWGLVGTAL